MTNHRAGKTNRRIPKPWQAGKREKKTTSRWYRRCEARVAHLIRRSR